MMWRLVMLESRERSNGNTALRSKDGTRCSTPRGLPWEVVRRGGIARMNISTARGKVNT